MAMRRNDCVMTCLSQKQGLVVAMRHGVYWDVLLVMFGGFAVAYGITYTLRDKIFGMFAILIGVIILATWALLLFDDSGRPEGQKR